MANRIIAFTKDGKIIDKYKTYEEFIDELEIALKQKKDKKYNDLLDKEAKENDWSMKAKLIIDLIKTKE